MARTSRTAFSYRPGSTGPSQGVEYHRELARRLDRLRRKRLAREGSPLIEHDNTDSDEESGDDEDDETTDEEAEATTAVDAAAGAGEELGVGQGANVHADTEGAAALAGLVGSVDVPADGGGAGPSGGASRAAAAAAAAAAAEGDVGGPAPAPTQSPLPAAVPLPHADSAPPAPRPTVVTPEPELVLGPMGPATLPLAAASASGDLGLLHTVKMEPGGSGAVGLGVAESRYVALAGLPFDGGELAALQRNYMEGRTVEKDMSTRTRHGTIRHNTRVARLRPAAESAYPQLWPHLLDLRQQAEPAAEGAADGAAAASEGGGSSSSGGSGGTRPRVSAASTLLFALRVLQEHERVGGLEAGPRDAVLARVLPRYGAEVAAAAQAAGVVGVDVVDLTADQIDIEEFLLQHPTVVAWKKVKTET